MGKLIVPLIIGLLMGISGGGFYAVNKVSATHAAAVATAKKHGVNAEGDSSHTEAATDSTAHGEGEHAAVEPPDSHAAGHDTTAHPAATVTPPTAATHAPVAEHQGDAHATTPTPTKPATVAAAGTSPSAAETDAHQRRLAKIFATMSAKDASRVLTQMNDHDVGIILGLLSNRQAAAILTNLPAPRAAALSQVQPRRGGGGT